MKEVVLLGYYGFDNLGDEAILAAIISSLQHSYPNLKITVLSATPKKTKQTYGVRAVDRFSFKQVIKTFRKADLLLLGGGSLLQDVTSWRSLYYYLGLIYLAKKLDMLVSLYAQGMGPVNFSFNRALLVKILNQVDWLSVRDVDSQQLLTNWGVTKQIELSVDPTFNLDFTKPKEDKELEVASGFSSSNSLLGVAVRYWSAAPDYLEKLAVVLNRIQSQLGVTICLLPFKKPEDLEASYELESKLQGDSRLFTGSYAPRQMAALIGELDLLIGVRLHALILAALQEVPLLGLSYDPKVDGFLARLNLKAAGRVENLEVDGLHKRILKIWQQRAEFKRNLAVRVKELQKEASQDLDRALEVLFAGGS
ncbi:polysaccharide pyruvyl transferase CsaB [Fuchsiella alkaliacetigena]|uniref:polysaccharide pyruvyl transferase CsaB n=1 Tax=Fuchsiella alkaliacetigena TaxID=957042 RepID=UPI00200ABB65|nr:polysaccharide pyruvyl transferase CsaB [Fuchsiella alkaliacetigena]MCK8824091.1 polysaccharide pyruvyl transferase CsaB [Fuchsiella alkaliacetigena]